MQDVFADAHGHSQAEICLETVEQDWQASYVCHHMGLMVEFPALSLLTIHEKGRGQQRAKGGANGKGTAAR